MARLTRAQRAVLARLKAGLPFPCTLATLRAVADLGELGLIAPERDAFGSPVRWALTDLGRSVAGM
jgi:hypothetical protein